MEVVKMQKTDKKYKLMYKLTAILATTCYYYIITGNNIIMIVPNNHGKIVHRQKNS